MLDASGWITCAVLGTMLSLGVGSDYAPARKRVKAPQSVKLDQGKAGADALIEAMHAPPRPVMSKDDASRFAAVLAAVKGGDRKAVVTARKAFADSYFNAKTRAHRRTLELIMLRTAADAHAPKLAKQARVAARFKRRAERLVAYVAAVAKALKRAEKTGKPAVVDFKNGGDRRPAKDQPAMSAEKLRTRLQTATKNMQEMNQSFNLQYLTLQQDMQSQNRQFTLMSNIMKTKHDTAKNAIKNVR